MFQDVPSCMIAEQSWDSSEAGLRQAVAIQRDRYAKKKKRISASGPKRSPSGSTDLDIEPDSTTNILLGGRPPSSYACAS
ncbi:hypothetical protein QC761_0074220 [Podospora bellae-mahoneyi]|uniref:Uncharacterized protein n=1 Tax=Podospora bellae-mahoneyi TaxID=2093777 RepID=A0ABR0FBV5_9PEZI|nr:hypothetical protein QC761_0074220 [Podospora bellae-mahoneyi]